jgi:stage V sporulation protein AC
MKKDDLFAAENPLTYVEAGGREVTKVGRGKRPGSELKQNKGNIEACRRCRTQEMVLSLVRSFVVGGHLASGWRSAHGNSCIGDKNAAAAFTSIIMIFLGASLTGLGIYDKIGQFAGAGSIVPITGFANSIVAPAMEFKREGYVMGVGAKLFSLAGPVLVYGIGSSVIVGLIYWLFGGWKVKRVGK